MYLYVTSSNLYCESGVSASAISCMYDYTTNRPVLANLNLCYAAVVNETSDKLLATVVHELIHTLGFSNSMFDLYINSDGNEIGAAAVASDVPAVPNSSLRCNYTMLVTPNVVQQVGQNISPSLAHILGKNACQNLTRFEISVLIFEGPGSVWMQLFVGGSLGGKLWN